MEPCPKCKGDDECIECGGSGWVAPPYDNSPPLEVVLDAALYTEVLGDQRLGED